MYIDRTMMKFSAKDFKTKADLKRQIMAVNTKKSVIVGTKKELANLNLKHSFFGIPIKIC